MTNLLGIDEVLKNLNNEIKSIVGDIQKGLTLAAMRIKADSMRDTPVDLGNLKNSAYVISGDGSSDTSKGKFDTSSDSGEKVAGEHEGKVGEAKSRVKEKKIPLVEIGYTAFYAEKVHEDMEASHIKVLYQKKGEVGPPKRGKIGEAKFLENAIRNNTVLVVEYIKRFAKR